MDIFSSAHDLNLKLKFHHQSNKNLLYIRLSVSELSSTKIRDKMSILSATSSKSSSDEAFYDNLTLGLMKILTNIPRVTNINYDKRIPCERSQITTWEQRHNVYLPDDMKRFFLSTDGFILTWSYQYSPTDVRRVGQINIPQLLKIVLLREHMDTLINALPTTSGPNGTSPAKIYQDTTNGVNNIPILSPRSKIFELSNICGIAKVCMVYETPDVSCPKIYLLEMNYLKWQFLADTFTEYLRMSIAHLGLPYWELCFSVCGLPSWAEQLFLLMAPHLLERNEPRRAKSIPNDPELPPFNTLDPAVFRTKPRCSRQLQKGR